MAAVPLFSHPSPAATLAWRDGRAVSARQFLGDVLALARRLPATSHVLNACADRYRFAVGLAACLVTRRTTLLPSTRTPAVIRRLAALAPDALCLTDDPACDIDLPRIEYRDEDGAQEAPWAVPEIDAAQTAAIVFTSGSTGEPLPHAKTWGRLAACVRAESQRLGLAGAAAHALVGTVPPQHMYGLESTVLLPLQSGQTLVAAQPFYPADVVAALGAAPRPRALVTTPVHLRALLAAGLPAPAVDLVVSATAPLARELARDTEERFDCPLIEIYGSTETGQIAARRTTVDDRFRLWPGVRLEHDGERTSAHGGHVERPTPLCDVIEAAGAEEFVLRGRTEDLVNIAGKRSSFAYLNHQLNSIPGVVDGVFFHGAEESGGTTGVARLAAAVVAPSLSAATLLERLRERIDPVFLPRPLLFVDRLPRNATGKLPRQALAALAAGGK